MTLADLGLAPIDVLDLVLPDDAQSMAELDDRVLAATIAASAPRPDADLMIQYLEAPPGGSSLFEASALVRAARDLVTRARPLRATDVMLSNAAASTPAAARTPSSAPGSPIRRRTWTRSSPTSRRCCSPSTRW